MFEEKITGLKQELITYAGLVEKMIEKSITGLTEKHKTILIEIIEKDEPVVNQREVMIDEMCTNMIAQFAPKAKDLRTILMILKMNNDIERLGDHAVNIAESALFLIEKPQVKPLIDLPKMAEVTSTMLCDSIHAFINEDVELARSTCKKDEIVDDLRQKILRELTACMSADPKTIERALHLIRISGNLERIADLSTNISEETIFMVAGTVIKHHYDEK